MGTRAEKLESLSKEQRDVAARLEALRIFDEASAGTLRVSLIKQMEEVTAKVNGLLKSPEEEPNHSDSIWQSLQAGLRALEENDKKRTEKPKPPMTRGTRMCEEQMRNLKEVLAHGNFPDEAEAVMKLIEEHRQKQQRERDEDPWPPADDSYFVAELQKLKDGTQAWAMAYALRDLREWENVQRQRPRGLYGALKHVAVTQDVPDELKYDDRAPEILLSAILSHELCINIVGEPFLVHPAFRDLYKTVQFDELDAHKWRSNTLRMIYSAMDSGIEPLIQMLGGPMDVQLDAWVRERAEMFRNEVASLMKRYITPACLNDLLNLYVHAVQIGGRFWTQRTHLRVLTRSHFTEPPIVVRNDTEEMIVHKYQNTGDPMPFLVPRIADILTHPLIHISGDGYSDNYEEVRTLIPWEVWMKAAAPIATRPPRLPYSTRSPVMSLVGRPIVLQLRQPIPPQPHNQENEIRQRIRAHNIAQKTHNRADNNPKVAQIDSTFVTFMWLSFVILVVSHFLVQWEADPQPRRVVREME